MLETTALPAILLLSSVTVFLLYRIQKRRKEALGKLGIIAEITVMLSSILGILYLLQPQLATMLPELAENPYVILAAFALTYVLIAAILVAVSTFVSQVGVSIVTRLIRKTLDAEILESSKLEVGGFLDIRGSFTGEMQNGYLSFVVLTPFGTVEKKKLFYNDETKLGLLVRDYDNEPFLIHWNIPSDLFGSEENYRVRIFIVDVHVLKLFKTFKWRHLAARWETNIRIVESKKPSIQIQKLIKPPSGALSKLDKSDGSKYVCVKIYNDTNKTHRDCFGTIKTDGGEFALYDYNDVVNKQEEAFNGKSNPFFTIESNAPKILCAKIGMKSTLAKVSIDVGKEEIIKELDIPSV